MKLKNLELNGWQLKLIAIAAMTIDHLAWTVFPGYSHNPFAIVLHILGRLTAPLMCFFIAEGFHYTHNLKKYILRVMAFAIPSHFAYMFCFGHNLIPFADGDIFNQTSVLWAFAWGLVALYISKSNIKMYQKIILTIIICAITFPADWSCIAVLVIVGFGCNRNNFKKQAVNLIFYVAIYAAVYAIFLDFWYGILQMSVVLSLPLIKSYNGMRGRKTKTSKWFFYIYYPLHLVLLGILRLVIQK